MRITMLAGAALAAALATMPFLAAQEAQQPGLAQAQAIAKADTGVGQYFTADQAIRGHQLYNRHCGYCHPANDDQKPTMSGIRGGALAPRLVQKVVEGIPRYPSAYYLYRRMEYMPPNGVDTVTPQERADILAYVLQQNGLMPGRSELTPDYSLLQGMPLPAEPGFVHVFNGRDLTGLKFLFGYHCEAPPEGCGRTDPTGIVSVKDGALTTNGRIHGMIYLPKKYKNFTWRLEQRVTLPWNDMDELIQDQTGLMAFVGSGGGPVRTWGDNMLEIEGKYHEILRISALGALKIKSDVNLEARRLAIKPVNQWQRFEIVSRDGKLTGYLNGVHVSTAEFLHDVEPGLLALQSQGGPVEWRNIRLRED
jgi:mono/diheme cytochrome c family protein